MYSTYIYTDDFNLDTDEGHHQRNHKKYRLKINFNYI